MAARGIGGAPIELAITSRAYKSRILGVSRNVEPPMNAVFVATGNNLSYSGDMSRRVIPVRINYPHADPEGRTFRHANIRDHAQQLHPRLLVAALTMLRAYHVAGRPNQQTPIGSFEAWCGLVRNAITWAGLPDPAEGRGEVKQAGSKITNAMLTVLRFMPQFSAYGADSTTAANLLKRVEEGCKSGDEDAIQMREALVELTNSRKGDVTAPTLGYAFRRHKETVVGDYRLDHVGADRNGIALWRSSPASSPMPREASR